ncbi:hypothetical protein REPUB_Repub10bG0027800 [Reevesia pubescens]
MEENSSSSGVSRKDQEKGGISSSSRRKSRRYEIEEGNNGGGDLIECSGKYCRSCTAGVIADCVALCCCPCALLNFLTLALVKVPWKIGRKCLGLGKNKKKKKRKCKKSCCSNCCSSSSNEGNDDDDQFGDDHGNLRERIRVEEGIWEFSTEVDQEEELRNFSARFEAERVWFELYQVGHLGFGRVSFTGI